ncbi:MAG: response regulator [Actinomycetota bacterium]
MPVKIVLVDDQPVPGLTLRHWLKKQRELDVVGEAVPGSPALALIQITEPDVVVLDIQTSPEAGLNMARLIRDHYPNVPIVAIAEATSGSLREEAAEAGAWAYFPKSHPEELPPIIRSLLDGKGKRFLDLTDRILARPPADSFVALPDHSDRRTSPEPPPPPTVVVAPRRPAKPALPAPPPPDTAAAQKVRRPAAPKGVVEVKPEVPPRSSNDVVAWVSPSLQPVTEQPARRKPRRRGKAKDQASEIDLRGPTGLPRRFGRHR